jgi:hypothetical protein
MQTLRHELLLEKSMPGTSTCPSTRFIPFNQEHPESTLNRVKDKIERQNSHVGIYREQNAVMNHAPRARVGSLH